MLCLSLEQFCFIAVLVKALIDLKIDDDVFSDNFILFDVFFFFMLDCIKVASSHSESPCINYHSVVQLQHSYEALHILTMSHFLLHSLILQVSGSENNLNNITTTDYNPSGGLKRVAQRITGGSKRTIIENTLALENSTVCCVMYT